VTKKSKRISSARVSFGLTIAAGIVALLTTATGAHSYCVSDGDCDDGIFCNGVESCDLGTHSCVAVSACPPSFPPTICNEITDTCDPYCTSDYDCNDGVFCNGIESCNLGTNLCAAVSACPATIPATVCDEINDTCVVFCTSDLDCNDGLFCNGVESCDLNTNSCVALSPCPPSIPPTVCNELTDTCDSTLIFEDGFESSDTSWWSNTVP